MTKEELLEYNKLCAEFLFPNAKKEYESGDISIEDGIFKKAMLIFDHFHLMKFHSDWNWIMEIVDKIENLDKFSGAVKIVQNNCFIIPAYYGIQHFHIQGSSFKKPYLEGKKEAVVQAIYQFLIWYNKNK